jgi:hypothetical protein
MPVPTLQKELGGSGALGLDPIYVSGGTSFAFVLSVHASGVRLARGRRRAPFRVRIGEGLSMRDRRLQRAIDTLNLYGGLMGAAEVADALGIKVPNLKWVGIEPVASISRGRIPVFLAADVQAEIIRREGRAAKAE